MFQYRTMVPVKILGKNKEEISVIGFRKRIVYPDDKIYIGKIKQEVLDRPDIIARDLYGNITKLSGFIDTNDIDIFSFNPNDEFKYADKNLAV